MAAQDRDGFVPIPQEHISPPSTAAAASSTLRPSDSDTDPMHRSGSVRSYKTLRDDHIVNIPLTPIATNASTGARREGQSPLHRPDLSQTMGNEHEGGLFHRNRGRRRQRTVTGLDGEGNGNGSEDDVVTTMGKFYDKLLNFSIVTRYLLYILPLGLILVIPILVGEFTAPHANIGGVKLQWFFIWLIIVWTSLWASKLLAKALPWLFQALVGVVSSSVKKYALVIKALEVPLSLVGWAVTSLATFGPLMTQNPNVTDFGNKKGTFTTWEDRVNKVLLASFFASLILLGQKLLIQIVSVDYHRRQFDLRIKENKANVRTLAHLYEVSRSLFPEFTEFAEEDFIIKEGLAGNIKFGGAAPVRQIIGNIQQVQDKVTAAFGNIAQEVTGNKNVFNPSSAYTTVVEALQRKRSAEALAKRIWLSFVAEERSALTKEDLLEVMGAEHEELAIDSFNSLDKDGNGDVSLDEMIVHVEHLRNERYAVAASMQDVDNAIRALDNVLSFMTFIVIVLVYVICQQSSVGTTLAGAGTVLISLSFVFSATAQEVLGSCIFLFVKHPYDVGDRIDVSGQEYIVEHISLLYTVIRRVDNNKVCQIPNNVLNGQAIENITRSKSMKETIEIAVNFGTSFEDLMKLKEELLLFVIDNSRDFAPEIEVEITGLNALDKLLISIDLPFRSNWANERLRLQRRNKFFCALVLILKKIPIYGAGAGDPAVGEQGKPMYTVAVTDELAKENMKMAREAKESLRWDYDADEDDSGSDAEELGKPSDGSSGTDKKTGRSGSNTSQKPQAVGLEINLANQATLSPFSDLERRSSVKSSASASTNSRLKAVSVLQREPTQGRRKANITRASSSSQSLGPNYQQTAGPTLSPTYHPQNWPQPQRVQSQSAGSQARAQQYQQYPQRAQSTASRVSDDNYV